MAYTLITGASSGIGAQTAIQLSSQYNLILCGRNIERLNEVYNSCDKTRNHLIWPYDLSNLDNLENTFVSFLSQHQAEVENFVHCAGLSTLMPLKDYNLSYMHEIMAVNLYSAMLIVKHLIRKKSNNKALKNVVMISAVNSLKAVSGNSFYAATKNAINSYIQSLAVELGDSIRANAILPGYIDTPMAQDPNIKDSTHTTNMLGATPLGIGTPTDIANMAEFLLSEKSRWITGQQFIVDGGYTA